MAAAQPQDPVCIQHIINRSAIGIAPIPAPNRSTEPPTPAQALSLVFAMKACAFRSSRPDCGCAGGRCALRRGGLVSHRDCFDCLQRYPDISGAETRRD